MLAGLCQTVRFVVMLRFQLRIGAQMLIPQMRLGYD